MNIDPQEVEALFERALAFPAAQRPAFLAGVCPENKPLRERVEALLATHESQINFLPAGPTEGPATILATGHPMESLGSVIGRYKLLEPLGEGGFGVVWAAEQREPVRRRVALKVIKLGMDTRQVVARFEAERQALALMDHPNIARVLDAGATDTGRPYFVMELVRGISITRYCDRERLNTHSRLELFIQVCHAIQHAHQKGIIHRDIKPSNILVTLHDGMPVPKVIDFGIAKATQAQLTDKTIYTQFQQFIGTPAYMSPEQTEMSGLDIDTRSDIYSLGVLLYELLSGSTPFDTRELMQAGLDEMRRIIREKEPVRPSTKLIQTIAKARGGTESAIRHPSSAIDADLDWVVMKCLEKDRARRYETANGVAADIRRYLQSEPVVARPPTPAYRFRKMVRRHKVAFAASLWLTAWIIPLQAMRANRAEQAAVRATTAEQQQRLVAVQKEAEAKAHAQLARRQLYAASMNLVRRFWDATEVDHVRELLAETATYPERGFEWYYWQRQVHRELNTVRLRGARIQEVTLSPDGQRVATADEEDTVRVVEVAGGRELFAFSGSYGSVRSTVFSPDGQRLVACFDRACLLLEAGTGTQVYLLQDDGGGLAYATVSPDGQRFVTWGRKGTAVLRELATGRELHRLQHSLNPREDIEAIAFSPNGEQIVTCGQDQMAKVWATSTGQVLLPLRGHSGGVLGAAFSPNGKHIVTYSDDHIAKVWDIASGRESISLQGHGAQVNSAVFSPDGRWIVTGCEDQTAKVWDASTGKDLFTLRGHSGAVWGAVFSPDGQRILTRSDDHTAKLWDAATGRELRTLKGHGEEVILAAFASDGQQIITGSRDRTVKAWEAQAEPDGHPLQGQSAFVMTAALTADAQRLATGSQDRTARLWDVPTGKELFTLRGHSNSIFSLAFSPNGERLVTGSGDGTARVWDALSGRELRKLVVHTYPRGGGQPSMRWPNGEIELRQGMLVAAVAFSPDGQWIVTGSDEGNAKVWATAGGQKGPSLQGHSGRVCAAGFSADGQHIVTGSEDGTARLWDAATGREWRVLTGHKHAVRTAIFSPDGQSVATGSDDATARVWDVATGRELLILRGHSAPVASLAFSPDCLRILTGSFDQTAKVWDLASAGELLTLQHPSKSPVCVSFAPNGGRITIGYQDEIRTWKAATMEQVQVWQREEQAAAKRK